MEDAWWVLRTINKNELTVRHISFEIQNTWNKEEILQVSNKVKYRSGTKDQEWKQVWDFSTQHWKLGDSGRTPERFWRIRISNLEFYASTFYLLVEDEGKRRTFSDMWCLKKFTLPASQSWPLPKWIGKSNTNMQTYIYTHIREGRLEMEKTGVSRKWRKIPE